MTRRILILVIIILVIAIVGFLIISCTETRHTTINTDVIGSGSFSEIDENTKTEVQAYYFIEKHKQSVSLIISAQFDIKEEDWAGIQFAFPEGVSLTEITFQYQEDTRKGLTTLTSTDPEYYDFPKMIEIGNVFHGSPSGGGKGSIIIDAQVERNDDMVKIWLGLGSSGVNMYPTHKIITINVST